ncbi:MULTISPECIES: MFS transporter [Comamonas]|uniref:MFS transporter n=1 Tax=Comamonas TaxID=283 RepID=UPI00050E1BE2|nr:MULTISPECIES: MFS transporter [Comamonas]KGG83585.1 major facilitator transporter [Comamonas thiooxydans]KGG96281.1 major facilitator transporter [Comamonas thiooxydans]KGH02715.1 major facilitator transporter [Comamonas thiooxydans]KGH07746.1 major facilitator transporter [Comamonas thiooxydans]TZG09314.1 MFS transporter [Comamonas thiooxydans]
MSQSNTWQAGATTAQASVWWVGFGLVVGVLGAALISPLYALYQQAWQLRPSDISLIYVLYMCGGLCALLFLGRLPDRIGFQRVMLCFLCLTLAGTLISMLAWNLPSLIVGRFMVGVSSSLITISATTGLTLLAASASTGLQPQRVAMVASFLNVLGFGLGPLIGGVAGQWLPQPLTTAYLVPLVLGCIGVAGVVTLKLPESVQRDAGQLGQAPERLHWRDCLPRLTWPVREDSLAFALTCGYPFVAFGVFGLYASMAPLFLQQMIPWSGPMVSGTAIAVILLVSAGIQLVAASLPLHRCGFAGMALQVLSNGMLLLNLQLQSTLLFILGVGLTALGHGMCMLAGMTMVGRLARPDNRAGMLSTYQTIGLLGSMLPMMAVGWIADHWSIKLAVSLFACFVMLLATLLGLAFARHPRMQGVAD